MANTPSTKNSNERLAALALVVIIALLVGGFLVAKRLTPTPETTPTPANIGAEQQALNTTILVESTQCGNAPLPARNAGGKPLVAASGTFCIATIQMTHNGPQSAWIYANEARLALADGKTYQGDIAANSTAYFDSEKTELAASNKARIQIAFDVPPASQPSLFTLVISNKEQSQSLIWNVSGR